MADRQTGTGFVAGKLADCQPFLDKSEIEFVQHLEPIETSFERFSANRSGARAHRGRIHRHFGRR